MSDDKDKLKAKLRAKRTDSTLFVFDDASEPSVDKQIKRAMERDGEALVHNDGRREWISFDVIHDITKSGSDAFTWNAAGTKVKHNKVRHILNPKTGEHTEEVIGTVFREF